MAMITPFLWFDNNAREAIDFYTGIFPDSKVGGVARYEGAPMPDGTVFTGTFELAGQEFMFLDGGPQYRFTEAISLFVSVQTQDELDNYWTKLTADGGLPGPCGWLKDKFGLSWQIVPTVLGELLGDPDPDKAGRAMKAMLSMSKLDIAALTAAHAG